jgi:PAS domain S-box-containing protein
VLGKREPFLRKIVSGRWPCGHRESTALGQEEPIAFGETAAHLFTLTDRLFRAKGPEEAYAAALDVIGKLLGCDRASILLFDEAGIMRFVAWRGLSDGYRKAVDGHSPWKAGQRGAEPIFVPDINETSEPDWLKQQVTQEGIVGLTFVPLFAHGEVIGKFMTYFPARRDFTDYDRQCAVAIARQVGFALERYRAERARENAETSLRESEERFRHMAEDAPVMIWISDSSGHCLQINALLREFWGVEDVTSFDWSSTLHPHDLDAVARQMQDAILARSSTMVKGRYRRRDGIYRVLETVARPNFGRNGEFQGMIGVNVDVTEREEADEHKRLLINELNHRVKNTLAVVQAVASQTFRTEAPRSVQLQAFEGRLAALAQAHNLLASESWQSASLEEVARKSVNGDADSRVRLQGPHVNLEPKQAVTTAMALHEMYTNAVKHGSLRDPSGTVRLEWHVGSEPRPVLTMRWSEQGPLPVQRPSRRGFGTIMIKQALGAELNADVDLDYLPTGLICTVTARLPAREPAR